MLEADIKQKVGGQLLQATLQRDFLVYKKVLDIYKNSGRYHTKSRQILRNIIRSDEKLKIMAIYFLVVQGPLFIIATNIDNNPIPAT